MLDAGHWLLPVDNPFALDATADGGANWHPLTTSGLSNGGWIVWIGALDDRHAAALVPIGNSYPSLAALYLTADGGVTWHPANLGGSAASASPTRSASVGNLAACRSSDVVMSNAGWGAAGGTTYASVTLTLQARSLALARRPGDRTPRSGRARRHRRSRWGTGTIELRTR